MIRQINLRRNLGTRSSARSNFPWRAEILINVVMIILFFGVIVERAFADLDNNTDEQWDLGVRLDEEWREKCSNRGGVSIFHAVQTGSEVKIRYFNPCASSLKYGFRENHLSIRGKIKTDGSKTTISGKIRTRLPPELSALCPEQSTIVVPVTGEVVVDQKSSKIKFTYEHSEMAHTPSKGCITVAKGTTSFEMTRRISVNSVQISQTEPKSQEQGKIRLVSGTRFEIPSAKFTVTVKFFEKAIPVSDAYPVQIKLNNDDVRTAMARRTQLENGNVYRIPWIKLVNK